MTQGPLLDERYELHEVLGRGGMAEVRRGEDLRLGRRVAVKTLRLDLTGDATFQARFRREAQSAAALNHPNVVAVYDTGEDALDGARVPYIVMEFVEGRTLRDLLRDTEVRMTQERALEITLGVLDALDYSHRAGIIHRDIKPANVMVTGRGDVKVMDFGIARALYDTGSTMTQTAAVLGTAQYLSPEQARGEQADARSDLYSTGCLLYELLTGRPPFVGDSLVSVAVAHVRDEPEPPSTHDPTIPPEVDQVVLTALAKEREARYQSASDMRADLERVLAGLPPQGGDEGATELMPRAAAAAAAPEPTDDALALPADEEEQQRRRRRWTLVAVLGVLALILAGVIGWLVFRGNPEDEKVSVPSVVGLQRAAAETALQDKGLKVEVKTQNDAAAPRNEVTEQDPEAGAFLVPGSTVTITVSLGPKKIAVPVLEGLSLQDADDKLRSVGLRLGTQTKESSTKPEGQVLSSDPAAGEQVGEGSPVDVTVSSGEVEVPNVVGEDRATAEAALRALGLKVEVRFRESTVAPGTVVDQAPNGGTTAAQGDTVILYSAVAPAPTQTPTATPTPPSTPTPTASAS